MIKFAKRRNAAMMTSASMLVLGALAPAAHAQQTDVGAPGQALTAGTISTTSGNINDNGPDNGVTVVGGSTPLVVVTGAVIDTRATVGRTALDIGATSGSTGPMTVSFAGVSTLQGSGSALQVFSGNQASTVNTGSGSSFSAVNGPAINIGTQAANLTVVNGANTITSANGVALVTSTQGEGASLIVNSTGGTLNGLFGGIQANTGGGSVVIGEGAGVTSAMSGGANGIGINSNTNGAGSIDVRTGSGGTINGVGTGINANSNGGAAVTVNVGGAIGQATAPASGVLARSAGGNVTVNITAALNATSTGVAGTSSGSGSVTVTSGAGSSIVAAQRAVSATTNGTGAIDINLAGTTTGGVYAISSGSGSTTINAGAIVSSAGFSGIDSRNVGLGAVSIGSVGQRVGTISGGTNGIFATTGGDISIHAGQVSGGTRGIVASNQTSGGSFTVNGAVLVDVTGLVTANSGAGVIANNNGALTSNTTTVRVANVISAGGSAISTFSNGGDTTITTGALTANAGNGTGWTGAFGQSNAGINLTVGGPINASFRGIDLESGATGSGGALTINAGGAINGYQGIRAVTTGGGAINIGQTTRTGTITTTNGAGIFTSGGGDINIATGAVTSVGGTAATIVNNSATGVTADSGFGIAALSSGGSININANGLVTGGAAGGILAQTTAPAGAVTINTAGVTASAGRGIGVTTVAGPIAISSTGPIQASSFGIQAVSAGAGAINIVATGPVNSTTANGIAATNTGSGAVNVGTESLRIGAVSATGATGTGITAFGAGDVSVYATSVTGGTRGIVAANQYTNPNGRVIIDATGPVVGLNSWGIIGINNGAVNANSLSITTGDVTGTGRTAISAQTVGGDINLVTNGTILSTASQTLSSNSSIFAESQGNGVISVRTLGTVTGYDGIYALSGGGAGSIGIVSAAAVTGTSQYGIYGRSNGGNIAIEARGPVSGAVGGVVGTVVGAGSVGIRTANVASSNGPAVFGQSSTGTVTINTGAATAAGGTTVTYGTIRNVADASATSGFGILGLSGGNNVSITATGLVTGGAAGGVLAQSSGAGSITINTAGVTAVAGRAIQADASGGAIIINATGAINALGVGIEVTNSGAGSISVNSTGAIVTGVGSNGIDAANTGTGATSVGTAAARTGAITAGATGVFATSQGNVNVFATSITSGTRGIVAASQGAAPNGVVVVDASGAITAASGFGIVGVNNGVLATNTLSITATGPIVSTGGSGISAQTVGGDITIRSGAVTTNTGTNGTWDGIFADGRGDALVSVATTGAVSGTFRGIDVSSTGTTARSGITITAGGSVTGGANQTAILAILNGQGTASIGTAAGTTLNAFGGTGIRATVNTATGTNGIAINNLAAIGGAGASRVAVGVAASIGSATNSGSITVNSSGGAIQATSAGILASTAGAGAINIGGTAGIGSAIITPVVGISGSTTSGALTINTAAAGTIAPGAAVGIQARTTTGSITINQAGSIGSTGAGNTVGIGIDARIASGAAALQINSTGGIYVSAGTGLQSAGIYASHGGTGSISVTSTGIIDPGAYGVVVQGGGDVSYVANGGLVEGGIGAYIASTGGGTVTVSSTAGTPVTGLSGVGIEAVGSGGVVTVGTAGAVSGATSGILASNTGTGATTVAATGAVTGLAGDGINVSGAAGVVSVTAAGPVTGTNSGIVATSTGAGSTVVTNTGAVTSSGGPAIAVTSGTGGLLLNVRGNVVSATGPAIVANSAAGGTINVAAGAVVAGRVDGPTGAVIALNTASGSSSTINIAQGASVQTVSGSPFTTAIRATGGSVVVNNAGIVSGQIDFSALSGSNTGQLSGGAGTTFQTGGLSVFGAGNDTFTNAGQLVTVGTSTTFDFRGGTNVFNNNGQVIVGSSPVSATGSTFLLASLTTFNNAGTLNLMNGVLGDSLVAPGSLYVGSGAAQLVVDTAVGAPGSRSDFLTVGTSSGRTSVVVRDTSPTAFGAYNPTGTVIVNGLTHAGDFVLDRSSSFYNAALFGGVLDKPGLFFSQLGVNAAGATVLVNLPKVEAYQFSTLTSQAQAVWYGSAPRASRQAEVRDQLASGGRAGGFWIDVQGTRESRDIDRHATSLAGIQHYDASYSQDLTSATIGFDAVREAMNGSVVFGGSVGYVDAATDFDQQSTSVTMDGLAASAYATFVRSGWFVAATIGANQLNGEIKAPRLTGFTTQDTDITSLGGTVEAGFRAPFLMGTTIEPSAAIAYVNSSVDDFTAAGSTFRFDDGESLRPSLGARLSGETGVLGRHLVTRFAVSVRGVGEAVSGSDVVIASAGPDLGLHDPFENAYGEVKAGLTGEGTNGFSVFGDLTGRYSDNHRAVGLSVGIRLRY